MVLHIEKCHHLPAWDSATVMEKGMPKPIRRAMEAAYILLEDTVNIKPGFYSWSRIGAKMVLKNK